MKRHSLDIVRHVYGEAPWEPMDELIERDDSLNDEYVALREVKALMDARPRQAPNKEAVNAVLQAAGSHAVSRTDRPPARPIRNLLPLIRTLQWQRPTGYAVAACLLLAAGYWIGLRSAPSPTDTVYASGEAVEEILNESADMDQFRAMAGRTQVLLSDGLEMRKSTAMDEILDWDDTDDLFLIQWRIGSLEENLSGSSWDRAVPLNGPGPENELHSQSTMAPDTALRRIYR